MKKVVLLTVLILLLSSVYLFSAVPCKINYQGRLIKDNVPVDGTKTMVFSIYDSLQGGDELWTSGDVGITVHNGLFRYVLGEGFVGGGPVADLSNINWTAGQALYLEVKIETDILTPREPIYAYPYAINSHLLEGATKEYFINISGDTQTKQGDLNIMGNVGIGDDLSPDAKLEIVKSASGDILNISSASENDGDLVTILNNGDVGIGTESPGAKLEVAGNFRATGGIEPDYDSGWVKVDRINSWGLKTLTHNLNYFPRQIQWWFSNGNPGTFIGPLASNTYKDHAGNPLGIWITLTQVKFSIWHDRYVYRLFNASSQTWGNYNSGYYRILLWR